MPSLLLFRRHEKKRKERLEIEYTTKEIRLKTTEQNKNEPRSLQQGRDDTDRGFGRADPAPTEQYKGEHTGLPL